MNENLKLGYLVIKVTNEKIFTGAILITDVKGFPLEFRYTDPISPTKIQQVLYGNGLEKYIKTDVIMESLISVLSSKMDILIVADEELVNYSNGNTKIIQIVNTNLNPFPELGDFEKINDKECLVQCNKYNNPIKVRGNEAAGNDIENIKERILECSQFIDILEPLNRVVQSIDLV